MEKLLEELLDTLAEIAKTAGLRILFALLTLVIGIKLAKFICKRIKNGKGMQRLEKNVASFLNSFIKICLYSFVFILCLLILGVPAASFVTAIASCGVAIGLAIQGSLANFAGGLMLLIFKPFQIGDYIEGEDFAGTVEDITILYTHVVTPDNIKITVPNGVLTDNSVKNYSEKGKRRGSIDVRVSYDCDFKKVRELLKEHIDNCPTRIKEDPTAVEITDYAESWMVMSVRFYATNENYWGTVFTLRREILTLFEENNIPIPYNKIDIEKQN